MARLYQMKGELLNEREVPSSAAQYAVEVHRDRLTDTKWIACSSPV
jgi:hypothetical protein